jgi:hypothetical protein
VRTAPDPTRDREDLRRGLAVLAVAVIVIIMTMTLGITAGSGPSSAAGAAAWVARERPAGRVLTIDPWAGDMADGEHFRVVTADDHDIRRVARTADPGSVVLPSDWALVEDLRRDGNWSVTYRDDNATVLVREGALPVRGAT